MDWNLLSGRMRKESKGMESKMTTGFWSELPSAIS